MLVKSATAQTVICQNQTWDVPAMYHHVSDYGHIIYLKYVMGYIFFKYISYYGYIIIYIYILEIFHMGYT